MMSATAGTLSFARLEREVVLCTYARSPFGRFNGALAPLDVTVLGAQVIERLLERSGVEPAVVDAVYCGIRIGA